MKSELNQLHARMQVYLDNVGNVIEPKPENLAIYESYYNELINGMKSVINSARKSLMEKHYRNITIKPKGRFGKPHKVVCDWDKRQKQLKDFKVFCDNIEDDDTEEFNINEDMKLK